MISDGTVYMCFGCGKYSLKKQCCIGSDDMVNDLNTDPGEGAAKTERRGDYPQSVRDLAESFLEEYWADMQMGPQASLVRKAFIIAYELGYKHGRCNLCGLPSEETDNKGLAGS